MNALTFLNTFRPDGTHILTAIHPETRGSVLTAPFRDDDEAMAAPVSVFADAVRSHEFSLWIFWRGRW